MFFLIVYSCLVIVVNTALPYVILNFINNNLDNILLFFFKNNNSILSTNVHTRTIRQTMNKLTTSCRQPTPTQARLDRL